MEQLINLLDNLVNCLYVFPDPAYNSTVRLRGHTTMNCTSPIRLAVGLALASAATAQAQQGPDTSRLEEVIVTAQKREQSALDTPVALAAFDGDALARQGLVQVAEVAHFAPGVHWENINVSKPQV